MKKSNQFFGELEAEIMDAVWQHKTASVRQVLTQLRKKKKIAYTTVMTVMSRLYEKGILLRHMDEAGAYVYSPAHAREVFYAHESKRFIRDLIAQFGHIAVAQFFDVLEEKSPENRQELKKLLKKIH